MHNPSIVKRLLSRLLLMFLLAWLPAQFAWAALSGYCAHEAEGSRAAAHFGHHEHQHEPVNGAAGDGTQPTDLHDANGAHPDCAACQFGFGLPQAGAVATVSAQRFSMIETASIPPLSPPLARPDRPNWRPA